MPQLRNEVGVRLRRYQHFDFEGERAARELSAYGGGGLVIVTVWVLGEPDDNVIG
jgi:hypothetical protein